MLTLSYSSKISWHNIFVNFVINPVFTKIFSPKIFIAVAFRVYQQQQFFTTINNLAVGAFHKIFVPQKFGAIQYMLIIQQECFFLIFC